jgi:hypothetical protein
LVFQSKIRAANIYILLLFLYNKYKNPNRLKLKNLKKENWKPDLKGKAAVSLKEQSQNLVPPNTDLDQELSEIKKDMENTEVTAKVILERLKRVLGKDE